MQSSLLNSKGVPFHSTQKTAKVNFNIIINGQWQRPYSINFTMSHKVKNSTTLFWELSLYLNKSRRNWWTSAGQILCTLRNVAIASGIAYTHKTNFTYLPQQAACHSSTGEMEQITSRADTYWPSEWSNAESWRNCSSEWSRDTSVSQTSCEICSSSRAVQPSCRP